MNKFVTITYRNSFHNTSASVRVSAALIQRYEGIGGQVVKLSRNQLRRADRQLCGMRDCLCGSHSNLNPIGFPEADGSCWVTVGTIEE